MAILPISKSTAVTMAPIHTSCQRIGTVGMNLKIIANRTVVMPIDTSTFTPCSSSSQPGSRPEVQLPKAATPALTTNDTMSKNASPRMSPNDSTRARRMPQTPVGFSFSGTCQMRSSALCSSAKTVVAPMISTTMLMLPAMSPREGELALLMSPWTAVAPSCPISPDNCAAICPCTASCPNNAPAMAMTMTSNGASENIV